MNIVKIKGIELGKGSPKICVPVTGRTKEEIRLRLEELQEAEPDLAEWRADWYEGVFDREKLEDELAFLRRELGNMPLLVDVYKRQGMCRSGMAFWHPSTIRVGF